MTKIETEMLEALAAYHGPVTKCPPGQARGADLPRKEDRTQRWLNGHRGDVPLRDERPSAGGSAWRAPSESGSQSGTPQYGSVTITRTVMFRTSSPRYAKCSRTRTKTEVAND